MYFGGRTFIDCAGTETGSAITWPPFTETIISWPSVRPSMFRAAAGTVKTNDPPALFNFEVVENSPLAGCSLAENAADDLLPRLVLALYGIVSFTLAIDDTYQM